MDDFELKIQKPERFLRDQVTEKLRQAVVRGIFSPGERLTERDLIDMTGVSRTSLREGLRQLQAEGLVEPAGARGLQVSRFSPADVAELYEVRAHLESAAVEHFVVARATDMELAELIDTIAVEGEQISDQGTISGFYRSLFAGARNSLLTSLYQSISAKIVMMQNLSIRKPGRADQSRTELRTVLDHIQNRDTYGACEAIRSHVRKAQEAALEELESVT